MTLSRKEGRRGGGPLLLTATINQTAKPTSRSHRTPSRNQTVRKVCESVWVSKTTCTDPVRRRSKITNVKLGLMCINTVPGDLYRASTGVPVNNKTFHNNTTPMLLSVSQSHDTHTVNRRAKMRQELVLTNNTSPGLSQNSLVRLRGGGVGVGGCGVA